MTNIILYLRFEKNSNRLELLLTTLKLNAMGSNPGRVHFSSFFLLTLFIYLQDPFWEEKLFFYNLIYIGIDWLNNAKSSIKYGTSYFQSVIKLKLDSKNI
jgi:hypothetical protein